MAALRSFRRASLVLASTLLCAGALVVACSNSSNPTPSNPIYNVSGDGGDAGKDASVTDSSEVVPDADAAKADTSTEPVADAGDAGDGASDAGQEAAVDAASCAADGGCWSCTPASTPEFLNQCTSSECSPFDNLQRLPDYDGGSLPPLQ
jgi:hypothetical protein